MPFTIYEASVPLYIRHLKILSKLLIKGQLHASPNESALIEARLIADMQPLAFQIQRVTDNAKGIAVRIGREDSVDFPNTETTFEQLQERIQKTIVILEKVDAEKFNSYEHKEVVFGNNKWPGAKEYIKEFGIPNFFFHIATTYAILRKEGVDIGKADFLGLR
jgi:hypothetical protein